MQPFSLDADYSIEGSGENEQCSGHGERRRDLGMYGQSVYLRYIGDGTIER